MFRVFILFLNQILSVMTKNIAVKLQIWTKSNLIV